MIHLLDLPCMIVSQFCLIHAIQKFFQIQKLRGAIQKSKYKLTQSPVQKFELYGVPKAPEYEDH